MFLSKDCEHSVVQLSRPVKLKKTPFRSRQSLRASIIYKGPVQSVETLQIAADQVHSTASINESEAVDCCSAVNGAITHTDDNKEQGGMFTEHQLKDLLVIISIMQLKNKKFQH